jgi:hypothetical protein
MAYTPNEHSTNDEHLVVLKVNVYLTCLQNQNWYSKGSEYGLLVLQRIFMPYTMQVYICKTDGTSEKKQSLQVVKDAVCHTSQTGTGITADNVFTSCELENFLLTRNMTMVGTV